MKDLPTYRKAVLIPDTHFPFHHQGHLDSALGIIENEQPDLVLSVGDVFESYCFSVHDKSLDVIGPREELRAARANLEAMWRGVQSIVPKAKCVQLGGNHDWPRIYKLATKAAPALTAVFDILDIQQLWRVDGVHLVTDWKSGFECRMSSTALPWRFIHGWYKHGEHARRNPGWNIGVGHLHKSGVFQQVLDDCVQYELNCGFLGDKNQLVFNYTPQRMKDWTESVGMIDEYGPRVINFT